MAKCPTDQQLTAWLQQRLPGAAVQKIESHLNACEQCQGRLDVLTSAADLIVADPSSSSIPDEVLAHLRDTPLLQRSTTQAADNGAAQVKSTATGKPPTIDGFDIHEHIASGASGALYKATDQKLGRVVAIKVIHDGIARTDSARSRLQREARAVAAVNHPHVVAVHSTGETDDGRPLLVMEFIDGQSISQQLEFTGPFAPLKAAEFVEQAAHGLAAAHANGLIHRDVKSSNILIEHQTQAAKVIDFGLVREDTQETRLTIDGMLAGTPAYISPEQIVDPSAVDAGTDVYSLGIVLYEMLTGTVPFRGVVRMTLQQVQHVEPQPLRELNDDIPRDLQTICLRAIEKDPERRYPTAAAFADDLRRFIDNRPIVARPVSRLEKSWRWCQRNPRISVLSALVAFAMMSTFGVTAAAAYRLSLAAQEVKEADTSARLNADALMVQRDAAMETVRKLVFDITPLLLELPADTSGVEEAILMTALEGLDRVADSAEDSGEIDYNTAYALQQLGYALYAAEDYENAKSQLNRCLNLVQKMKAGDETVTLTAAMEHEVHLMLADVLQAEGDPANELIQLETSLRIAEDWANIVPVDPDALLAKSVTLRLIGAWMNEGGKASESDRYMQSSREVVTDVLKEWPDHEIALIELEELDAWQPEQIEGPFTPEVKRKKRNLQSELRTMERHLIENGDSPVSRASVVNALSKLARWHTVFGDSDQAEVLYDRVRDLISEDADVDAVQLLRIDRLAAEACLTAGYTRRARNSFRGTLAALQELPEEMESDVLRQTEILACKRGLADGFLEQANGVKAQPLFAEIVEWSDTHPTVQPAQRRQVVLSKIGLAWAAVYQANDDAVPKLLKEAKQAFDAERTSILAAEPPPDIYVAEWLRATADDLSLLEELGVESADDVAGSQN